MDDTIYRQAAINVADVTDCIGLPIEDVKRVTDEVIKGLKKLPSAEKNVPVPIEQYANMILAMQKLEDIKSIVRQAGYIGARSSSMFNDNEDALLSIAAILKGEDA